MTVRDAVKRRPNFVSTVRGGVSDLARKEGVRERERERLYVD